MKRVLVTGGTGFIGHHCIPLLLGRGFEVHCTSSKSPSGMRANVQWHHVDLLEPGAASDLTARIRPTHILHFAWYTSPGLYWTARQNLTWVEASLSLLETFTRTGGERIVMAGTCAEYNWDYGYCSEFHTPLAPKTLYGASKHSLQTILASLSRQAGLSSSWGRIFFIYGPKEHPDKLVSSVVRSLSQAAPASCSLGNQIRDYLYVEDAADAFVALLDSNVQGPVNIASGQPLAVKAILHNIAAHFGRPDLIKLGVLPARPDDPPLLVADVSRLSREVCWQPQYDLDRGLAKTIRWWKDHLAAA